MSLRGVTADFAAAGRPVLPPSPIDGKLNRGAESGRAGSEVHPNEGMVVCEA